MRCGLDSIEARDNIYPVERRLLTLPITISSSYN